MPTDQILQLLVAERDRLTRAIEVLQGGAAIKRRGRPPKDVFALNGAISTPWRARNTAAVPAKKRTRTFTAAQRRKQAERMKAYWAAKKKQAAKKTTSTKG